MEVAEVGAPLVVGYIGCCLAIGFHWDATPYLALRSHAFILRVDIAFVIHAWFIHGVTQTWWCARFHGQGEHVVSPLCNESGHLGLSEAFWRISTRPLRASRS